MRTKLAVLCLLIFVTLWSISVVAAYRRGYQQGIGDDRSCWVLDPAPVEAWRHGVVTARRDTQKHPFFEASTRVVLHGNEGVNWIPTTYSP